LAVTDTRPADATNVPVSVDEIVTRLKARVEERRRTGFYPAGLEADLDAHFKRVAFHPPERDFERLHGHLETLDHRSAFSISNIPLESETPGAAAIHRVVARVVGRQTQGILEQVQAFADAVRDALHDIVDELSHTDGHIHPDLLGQVDAIFERLATFERGPADAPSAISDLRRRLDVLEAAEARRRFKPWYTNEAFESAFRGSSAEMRERYRDIAVKLSGYAPIIDIGCGRGELLDLLAELGTPGRGIEVDPELVEAARARGHEVHLDDAVSYLASQPDHSIGAVAMIQVIEHLTPQEVVDLVAIARDKIMIGGVMIAETVNPQSLYTFAHSFYVDPTHHNPVHPAYLKFLFDEAGFEAVQIDWRSLPSPSETLDVTDGASSVERANVERLNRLLFAPQDYALVAQR
jgi:SAM-dependent methyltransferase